MNRVGKALLILNLQILLIYPQFLEPKQDRGTKTQDQYWAETGLGSKELEDLISDTNCRLDVMSFLACANTLNQMAEKVGFVFEFNGSFRPTTAKDISDRITEKKVLAQWQERYFTLVNKVSFLKSWQELDQKYINPKERSQIIAQGLNGFLSIFKDPHSYLIPVAMYEQVVAQSDPRIAHSGLIARRESSQWIVRKIYPQSPAAKAGLRKGDVLVSMNGEKVQDMIPSRVGDFLKLKGLALMDLVVRRGQENLSFLLERNEQPLPSVSSELIESRSNGSAKLGLITIHKFSRDVCSQVKAKINFLKQESIQGMLLDLRDNPGGQVDEAACVSSLFLEPGTFMFETRYLDPTKPSDQYIANEDQLYKGPLAVLINSGSASASEIVAGSLKDNQRARLVGERSFGKGSFQDGKIWQANPKVALFQTEGFYYFSSGWTPQLVGLQPDVEVKFNNVDSYREEEVFLRPLVPNDSWAGPQSISWLLERECNLDTEVASIGTSGFIGDDPQIAKAQALMNCGVKNDRNGSL